MTEETEVPVPGEPARLELACLQGCASSPGGRPPDQHLPEDASEQSVRKKHQAALFPLKNRKKAEDPFVRRDYVCPPYCYSTPHKKPLSNHLVSTDLSAVDSPDC